jgi:hypothetical protein
MRPQIGGAGNTDDDDQHGHHRPRQCPADGPPDAARLRLRLRLPVATHRRPRSRRVHRASSAVLGCAPSHPSLQRRLHRNPQTSSDDPRTRTPTGNDDSEAPGHRPHHSLSLQPSDQPQAVLARAPPRSTSTNAKSSAASSTIQSGRMTTTAATTTTTTPLPMTEFSRPKAAKRGVRSQMPARRSILRSQPHQPRPRSRRRPSRPAATAGTGRPSGPRRARSPRAAAARTVLKSPPRETDEPLNIDDVKRQNGAHAPVSC